MKIPGAIIEWSQERWITIVSPSDVTHSRTKRWEAGYAGNFSENLWSNGLSGINTVYILSSPCTFSMEHEPKSLLRKSNDRFICNLTESCFPIRYQRRFICFVYKNTLPRIRLSRVLRFWIPVLSATSPLSREFALQPRNFSTKWRTRERKWHSTRVSALRIGYLNPISRFRVEISSQRADN